MKSYRVHEILVTPFVSRGRIRISKKKRTLVIVCCVGRCETLILAAAAVARRFLNASTIRCQRSSVDGSRSTTATTEDGTRVQVNVQRSNWNFLIRPLDATKNLIQPLDGKKNLPTATTRRRRRRKRTEDNETEQRRDERVLLDRVADRLGGLSGRPSGRPVLDPPKTLKMSPGLVRTQNPPILNRTCIEKYTDFDGRRI